MTAITWREGTIAAENNLHTSPLHLWRSCPTTGFFQSRLPYGSHDLDIHEQIGVKAGGSPLIRGFKTTGSREYPEENHIPLFARSESGTR